METKIAIYEDRMKEIKKNIVECLNELDIEKLNEFGLDIYVDVEKLEEEEYIENLKLTIDDIKDRLNKIALDILEKGGY